MRSLLLILSLLTIIGCNESGGSSGASVSSPPPKSPDLVTAPPQLPTELSTAGTYAPLYGWSISSFRNGTGWLIGYGTLAPACSGIDVLSELVLSKDGTMANVTAWGDLGGAMSSESVSSVIAGNVTIVTFQSQTIKLITGMFPPATYAFDSGSTGHLLTGQILVDYGNNCKMVYTYTP